VAGVPFRADRGWQNRRFEGADRTLAGPGFYAMFAAEERHVVSDESESPKGTAELIFKGLTEGRFRVTPATSATPD
jgi:hypothetical protein